MQRIIIIISILIILVSCGRRQTSSFSGTQMSKVFNKSEFIQALHNSAHYGDTHAYTKYHGRYWEVFGEPNDTTYFGMLTTRITIHEFDSITGILNKSLGIYTYNDKTAPIDSAYFWMGTIAYTKYHYWCMGNVLVAWGLFEAESGMGYAHLDIYVRNIEQKESWVQELKQRNPLVNDTKYISVYFKYDTIVNGYDVRGIYFPSYCWENRHDSFHGWFYESGVIMYFRNVNTGKEYEYTDFDEGCKCFKTIFTSKNVYDINTSEDFKGYKSGDAYIFHYYDGKDIKDADFQFLDIDHDGKDEVLLCYYQGGPFRRNAYEILEITDSLLESTGKTIDVYDLETMTAPTLINSQAPYPQITSFTDYTFEERRVFLDEDSINFSLFYHLDIEFPMAMKNKKVLARIQEQLIDTLFNKHYHTTRLDKAISKYWNVKPNMIKRTTTYSKDVPDDSDEYFNHDAAQNVFEHFCGRTSYNQDGLYIMRHHYTWFGGGCHHYPNTSFIAFDTRTGKFVHFLDIFSEEYEDLEKGMTYDIEYVVFKAIREKYPDPATSTQYWDEASFTLTPKSLVLHYTHYTLGCWAQGEHEVAIPADTAKLFLNPKWKHLFQ